MQKDPVMEKLKRFVKKWAREEVSFLLLAAGLVFDNAGFAFFGRQDLRLLWYAAAFAPVAWPVLKEMFAAWVQRDFFNEFTLMLLASLGAFLIGEYPEAVAVMLFYAVGEELQEGAVRKTRADIRDLLEMHPGRVRVWRSGAFREVDPAEVVPGEETEVSVGEKTCLDGVLLSSDAVLNTAALTGESLPRNLVRGDSVPAGCVVERHSVRIKVEKPYSDSALARMARLVEEASKRKSRTEIFMRRIARVYTPAVMAVALAVVAVPAVAAAFTSYVYDFPVWLYRALVFLVVSCPCALVVSIPLSYFAGIGSASRKGILFKGGNGLDAAARIDAAIFDKTGTLTYGKFSVTGIGTASGCSEDEWLSLLASLERASRHPISQAIVDYAGQRGLTVLPASQIAEIPGQGLRAEVGGHDVLAGNSLFLKNSGIAVPDRDISASETAVVCAVDGEYAGYVVLTDLPKEDAASAMEKLRNIGVEPLAVLSGDSPGLVADLARRTGISNAHGGLLPEEKVEKMEEYVAKGYVPAFVGDGINDSPVLAASALGVAMGKMGSDAAIETADVVLQTDCLERLADAVTVARRTRRRIWENVIFAFSVKIVVMVLGVMDMASLWAAVFADTGVALIAVLNSVRGMWGEKSR